jgi:hypothetical protein
MRAVILSAVLASPWVWAQAPANPEEEWKALPSDTKPPPPPATPPPQVDGPVVPALPSTPSPAAGTRPYMSGVSAPRPVLEPNTISMFGARSLGFLNRGEMFYLGFPLLGIRISMGVAERVDVAIGYDSFYFMSHEPRVGFRVNFFRGPNWSMAAGAEGGWAFFNQRASVDLRGARWLTGRRNFNIVPGYIISYQGDHPRAARLFLSLQYMLTLDTEPYQKDPLGGVPASVQVGHNVLLRAGAEMPLSAKTSFVFLLGLDVHGRPEDAPVMPVCSVGLVTSI